MPTECGRQVQSNGIIMKQASAGRSAVRSQRKCGIFSEGTFLIAIGATILLAALIATVVL
jgi:hypothetical protein